MLFAAFLECSTFGHGCLFGTGLGYISALGGISRVNSVWRSGLMYMGGQETVDWRVSLVVHGCILYSSITNQNPSLLTENTYHIQ